jgi:hypothetical protein
LVNVANVGYVLGADFDAVQVGDTEAGAIERLDEVMPVAIVDGMLCSLGAGTV